MSYILEVNNISKSYGKQLALDNISFKLTEGKIYGLLGRNGAGKTTFLNILTNNIPETSGDILFDSENVWENASVQSKIYYMTEKNLFPKDMKIKEIFKTSAMFYPEFDMDYALSLAQTFKINLKKKYKTLSKGYESLCKICIALASNAQFVILDEPVLGLDAAVRDLFYKILIENFTKTSRTFLISTHLIEEIADIIEEAIILKNGKLLLHSPVEEILTSGYCVAGKSENVDNYSKGKRIINEELVGNFKTTTIFETKNTSDLELAKELDVEIVPMALQKLFVHLTAE